MKKTLSLLALVALGLAAFGCDPGSKDEPTAPVDSAKATPHATAPDVKSTAPK